MHDIIGRLKSAPGGYKHVADDGVIRSFGPDGAVVDAARLTNAQLMKTALDHYDPDARNHLEEIWSGVDGHNVSDSQLYAPEEHLLPLFVTNKTIEMHLRHSEEEQLAIFGRTMDGLRNRRHDPR